MKKYTIEELKTNKIAFRIDNKEQHNKISKLVDIPDFMVACYYRCCFEEKFKDYKGRSSTYLWYKDNNYTIINFEQIDFQEEIPERWFVCPETEENLKIVIKWLGKYEDYIISYKDNAYSYQKTYRTHKTDSDLRGYKEITFEQFKKLINKKMEAPKTFSITGKERHLKAILGDLKEMGYVDCEGYSYMGGDRTIYTNADKHSTHKLKNFKEIGLFSLNKDSWDINFNLPEDYSKVLEHAKEAINSPFWNSQKEEIVSVGGKFDVKIKDGKVYHSSDDITEFVKEMIKFYDSIPTKFDKYECTLKNATFFKTGCQNTETTLDDWKVVFNKLK